MDTIQKLQNRIGDRKSDLKNFFTFDEPLERNRNNQPFNRDCRSEKIYILVGQSEFSPFVCIINTKTLAPAIPNEAALVVSTRKNVESRYVKATLARRENTSRSVSKKNPRLPPVSREPEGFFFLKNLRSFVPRTTRKRFTINM